MFVSHNDEGFDLAIDPDYELVQMPGWFHFGSRLKTSDEVRSLYQKIKSEAPQFIKRDLETYDDFVFFHCTDPDGYHIEVYWE